MNNQQDQQAILNCVYMAQEMGFEQVSQSRLPQVLRWLQLKGQAYIRDSIVLGMDMISRFHGTCALQNAQNSWHVVQIVIIDGADGGSQNSLHTLKNLLINSFQKFPQNFKKIIFLCINIQDLVAKAELQELSTIGQIEIIDANYFQIDEALAKISSQSAEQVDVNGQKKKLMVLLNLEASASMQNIWLQLRESINKFIKQLNNQDLLCAIGFNEIFQILTINTPQVQAQRQQQNNQLAIERSRNMKKYAITAIIIIVIVLILGFILRLVIYSNS